MVTKATEVWKSILIYDKAYFISVIFLGYYLSIKKSHLCLPVFVLALVTCKTQRYVIRQTGLYSILSSRPSRPLFHNPNKISAKKYQ